MITTNDRFAHRCVGCGRIYPHTFVPFCECGEMIDIEYDLRNVKLRESKNPLERFFDLLPLQSPEPFRGRKMEYTPCIHAKKLGNEIGMSRLYLKNETVLPTRSTK